MTKLQEYEKQIEFIRKLKANELTTPNEFTIGMGELIKKAREEKGMSQSELATSLKRRQGTISEIENGKSEIGILTLIQFAIVLKKPISYFLPESLLRNELVDVKTPFEHKMLEIASFLEPLGGSELTLNILGELEGYFYKEMDMREHPENYYDEIVKEEKDNNL